MTPSRPLRIAIDCRILDARQGLGASSLALAKALSESPIQHQTYTFVVLEEMRSWIEPYLYGPCTLALIPPSPVSRVKLLLRGVAPLRFLWKALRRGLGHVPRSDGFLEAQGFDVVHFPTQTAYLTSVPSIYQPWDLQHIHLPQFFSKDERSARDRTYRAFCEQATFVCVQAEWTRRDLITNFALSSNKIVTIPWGSVFEAYTRPSAEVILATKRTYSLPEKYFFYPAVTWPHKNHELIFHALAQLKQEGVMPKVYFSGASTRHLSVLERLAKQLGIESQIRFLGFLAPDELQAVLAGATAMVFPSRFEGFGLPILEAFHAEVPVLASSASTLPEVAQDGALFFNPDAPQELAELMKRLLCDDETRRSLIARGSSVLSSFSMQDTVLAFQALYDRTSALHRSSTMTARP